MTTIQIAGHPITIRRLSAAQLAAGLVAYDALSDLEADQGITGAVIEAVAEAVAVLSGLPRAEVLDLPLAEFIDSTRDVFVAVMSHNAEYLQGSVLPALSKLNEVVSAMASAVPNEAQ